MLLWWRAVEGLRSVAENLGDLTVGALLWGILALELFALLSVPSVLLRRRGRPLAALAWLLALFGLPAVGGLAWWAFGRNRLERKRRRHWRKKRSFAEKHGTPEPDPDTVFDVLFPPRARGDSAFATRGNQVELLADGRQFFPRLLADLRSAQHCIHLSIYIFSDDLTGRKVLDVLAERARAGVTVRLLLDGFGSQRWAGKIRKRLRGSGVEVATFLPSRLSPIYSPRLNFVNHRKVVVVDEQLAFTGGMNFAREYEESWRDVMVRIRGPAVRSLHHVFLEDWHFATTQALPEPITPEPLPDGCDAAVVASGPDTEPWIHDAYFTCVNRAMRWVDIATPYFIPSAPLLTALRTAAGRGVAVRIVVPSESDVKLVKWASRSYYRPLVTAGVRIFEYSGPMLHAKVLVQDDSLSSVGTANIDSRSLGLSFEVSCFIESAPFRRNLSDWLDELFANSHEITPDELDRKGTGQKLAESAAHLLSPIL